MEYLYPDNLIANATSWLWKLRDIGIILVGLCIYLIKTM
jgi:hypothetical protein